MPSQNDLLYHHCDKGDGWMEYDARGIPLQFVCDKCVDVKMAQYRPDVLRDSNYEADEEIEGEPDNVF